MDEYDRRLVAWFDSKFWPMLGKELYFAEKMARQKEMGQHNPYWEGYHNALGLVNSFVEDAIEEIRDIVEGEDEDEDKDEDEDEDV